MIVPALHGFLCLFLQLNQGNRNHYNRIKETEEADIAPSSEIDSSSSSFPPNGYRMPSQTTDTTSLSSAQASEYEDAESGAPAFFSFNSLIIMNSFFPPK